MPFQRPLSTTNHTRLDAHARDFGKLFICGKNESEASCSKEAAPEHASWYGKDWACDRGYQRHGAQCVKFAAPANAHIVENDWQCNSGYKREQQHCVKFEVPANANAAGEDWYCKAGYTQEGDHCVQMDAAHVATLANTGDIPLWNGKNQSPSEHAGWMNDLFPDNETPKFNGLVPLLIVLLLMTLLLVWAKKVGWLPRFGSKRSHAQGRQQGNQESMRNKPAAPDPLDPRINWHHTLCVAEHASKAEIKKAYKRMIGKYHPDKLQQSSQVVRDIAEQKAKAINIAYDYAMSLREA